MRGQNSHRAQGFRGGGPRGNGGGQGSGSRSRGRGRGRGKGRGQGGYHTLDEMVQMDSMSFQLNNRASTPPRGRGSGRGGFSASNTPSRAIDSPGGRGRGRGRQPHVGDSPGRGRGRGRSGSKLRPGVPLSELLYRDRPYLRPVVFVRSVHTRTLFQEEEEILQPVVEEVGEGEQSHVPTADRVFRVFSGGNPPPLSSSTSEDEQEASDDLEEIDFNDIDKLLHVRDLPSSQLSAEVSMVEEKFTGFYIDVNKPLQPLHDAVPSEDAATPTTSLVSMVVDHKPASPSASTDLEPCTPRPSLIRNDPSENSVQTNDKDESKLSVATGSIIETPAIPVDEEFADFYIDTEPSAVIDHPHPTPDTTYPEVRIADSDARIEEDDEIIVYVAPHPRSTRITSPLPSMLGHRTLASDLPSTSILTGTTATWSSLESTSTPAPAAGLFATPTSSPRASTSTPSLANHNIVSTSAMPTSTHTSITTTQTPAAPSTPISIPPVPSFSSITITPAPSSPGQRQRQRRYQPPISTPQHRKKAQAKIRKQEARAARRAQRQPVLFGSFGAMMEEAQLQDRGGGRDPRWEERRRGDSDVDWGDEDEDEGGGGGGGVQKVELEGTGGDSKGKEKERREDGIAEGMDLDPELELDADAMRSFVQGMDPNGQTFTTMDDIADAEMMRREDEDGSEDRGSSGEEEEIDDDEEINAVLDAKEELLIAEVEDILGPGDDDDDDEDDEDTDDSDDELQSPKSSFQARLERLRNRARSSRPKDVNQESSEDEDDDMLERNLSWADEDEDFIAHIQSILDENEDVLTGRDRKEKNKLFRAVHNGAFEDVNDFSQARKRKDKYKDLPPALQVQWQQDREKKAEYKRQRALEKLATAADPLIPNKGGKKGRKAMLAASKLDPTITVLQNRIIDMTTLVQQIRRFLADIDGPSTMSLPPTDKGTRKNIHEMAVAFGLKSQSKGKGNARYTTLIRTSRSGIAVDEQKVMKIARRGARGARGARGGGGGGGGEFVRMGGRRAGNPSVPKHREGDEVGKAAPKIGESNIGFKMLASMGWSEGDRIGITGGLHVPLTAVIKHTKLGLGASK